MAFADWTAIFSKTPLYVIFHTNSLFNAYLLTWLHNLKNSSGLHRITIRPDPYCMLCTLHEHMDRNHLGQGTALSNRTECERYWEVRTKIMENWLRSFYITIFVTAAYCWDFCIYCECSFFFMFYVFPLLMYYLLCNYNIFTFIVLIGQW